MFSLKNVHYLGTKNTLLLAHSPTTFLTIDHNDLLPVVLKPSRNSTPTPLFRREFRREISLLEFYFKFISILHRVNI
jgi:hypothetical protein